MKKSIYILFILTQISCASYISNVDSKGKNASGIIIDGDTNEPIDMMHINEYAKNAQWDNIIHTDSKGRFQIEFDRSKPIVVLARIKEVIYCELELGKENIITIDATLLKKSRRLHKRLKRTKE